MGPLWVSFELQQAVIMDVVGLYPNLNRKEYAMCFQSSFPMSPMFGMSPFASPFSGCCSAMMPMGGGMMANPMGTAILPEEFQKLQLQFQHQQMSLMKANVKALSESIDKSLSEIEKELKRLESTKPKKGI
jgi:hypothetical protein